MKPIFRWSMWCLGALWLSSSRPAAALPGQLTEEVTAWIQGNPTLRPSSGETLLVRKFDTAAQRFTFQASVLPPGKVAPIGNSGRVRTERISLFDMINGVTEERLAESLRAIYGLDIYQDFERARVVYSYPGPMDVDQARNRQTPLQAALQGQLRLGDRFGYWMETAPARTGQSYTGQLVVFLREDLDKLETELRNR